MIHHTGYWSKQHAALHHRHSTSLSSWLCRFLSSDKSTRIYDFGCGMGTYLDDLHACGHSDVVGVEGDPPSQGKPYGMIGHDLCEPFWLGATGTVISLEVGEHIPPTYMPVYLDNVFRHTDRWLLMSWAVRGQGGSGHVNELNNDEVIQIVESSGFSHDEGLSQSARSIVEDDCWWFRGSFFVFERKRR